MMQEYKHYKSIFKQFGSFQNMFFCGFGDLSCFPFSKIETLENNKVGKFPIKKFLTVPRKTSQKVACSPCNRIYWSCFPSWIFGDHKGIQMGLYNISGIFALILLIFLLFMGLKRFKRQDKGWHFKLAIGFLILFMIHASF